MRILVSGYPGLLSCDLLPVFREAGHEVVPLSMAEMDITQKDQVLRTLENRSADLLINCAGYTDVDGAEGDWQEAFRANTLGVHNLSLACRRLGMVLCQLSTDYVFDGRQGHPYHPWDAPNPINVYGASKRAAEFLVERLLHRYYIVRTSSLYGKHGKNFVAAVLEKAEQKKPLAVVIDQIMSPTWTVNLAYGLLRIIESGQFGVYHLTDSTPGGISWFEFAQAVLRVKGLDREITPLTSAELQRPAPRPAYSVLDTRYLTLVTGYQPLDYREALERFLR